MGACEGGGHVGDHADNAVADQPVSVPGAVRGPGDDVQPVRPGRLATVPQVTNLTLTHNNIADLCPRSPV